MVPMWKFPQNIPAQELHQSKEPREAGEPRLSVGGMSGFPMGLSWVNHELITC
jgi:hypothetical protein